MVLQWLYVAFFWRPIWGMHQIMPSTHARDQKRSHRSVKLAPSSIFAFLTFTLEGHHVEKAHLIHHRKLPQCRTYSEVCTRCASRVHATPEDVPNGPRRSTPKWHVMETMVNIWKGEVRSHAHLITASTPDAVCLGRSCHGHWISIKYCRASVSNQKKNILNRLYIHNDTITLSLWQWHTQSAQYTTSP